MSEPLQAVAKKVSGEMKGSRDVKGVLWGMFGSKSTTGRVYKSAWPQLARSEQGSLCCQNDGLRVSFRIDTLCKRRVK